MDVSYINPFISATIACFNTMIALSVKPGNPELKREPFISYDISGIIGISGDAQGSISISFEKDIAVKIISAMLGSSVTDGPDLVDAIGELANIIAGNAKSGLSQFSLSISLPNVIIGKNHVLSNQSGTQSIVIPFYSDLGKFNMEISLKTR
jgi:chemotaxis protein CheX